MAYTLNCQPFSAIYMDFHSIAVWAHAVGIQLLYYLSDWLILLSWNSSYLGSSLYDRIIVLVIN